MSRKLLDLCLALMLVPALLLAKGAGGQEAPPAFAPRLQGNTRMEKVIKSDEEWQKLLTPEQYRVLRKKGTEAAFCSPLHDHKEKGMYCCAACGLPLFRSEAKFDSGTGWPGFREPVAPEHLVTQPDNSWGIMRTEVLCARCDSHLGHVFADGPPPTGLRYCINGVALKFVPDSGTEREGK